MGLDNGFIIKKKSDPNFELEIAYFRKFFELDDFIARRATKVVDDWEHLYKINYDVLKDLKEELLPTIQVLIGIPERSISKYDDNTYPKKYKLDSDELISDEFNPITSRSAFAGLKAMRLYNAVCTMMEFLINNDYSDEYYIEFYSSW